MREYLKIRKQRNKFFKRYRCKVKYGLEGINELINGKLESNRSETN